MPSARQARRASALPSTCAPPPPLPPLVRVGAGPSRTHASRPSAATVTLGASMSAEERCRFEARRRRGGLAATVTLGSSAEAPEPWPVLVALRWAMMRASSSGERPPSSAPALRTRA